MSDSMTNENLGRENDITNTVDNNSEENLVLQEREKEKFFKEQGLVENYPYPELQDYFTTIANKLLDNDNLRSTEARLASLAGKIKFWWTNKERGAFIYATKNGFPMQYESYSNEVESVEWNIALNPLVLSKAINSGDGKVLSEDHYAAIIAHELSHVWNKMDFFVNSRTIDETLADKRAIDLMEKAGYNPVAMREMMEILHNDSSSFATRDIEDKLSIILQDPHLPHTERIEMINGYMTSCRKNQGTNYDEKLAKSFVPMPVSVQKVILQEREVSHNSFRSTKLISETEFILSHVLRLRSKYRLYADENSKVQARETLEKINEIIDEFPEEKEDFDEIKGKFARREAAEEQWVNVTAPFLSNMEEILSNIKKLAQEMKEIEFDKNRNSDEDMRAKAEKEISDKMRQIDVEWVKIVSEYEKNLAVAKKVLVSYIPELEGQDALNNKCLFELEQAMRLGSSFKLRDMIIDYNLPEDKQKECIEACDEIIINARLNSLFFKCKNIAKKLEEDFGYYFYDKYGIDAFYFDLLQQKHALLLQYMGEQRYADVSPDRLEYIYEVVKYLRDSFTDKAVCILVAELTMTIGAENVKQEILECAKIHGTLKHAQRLEIENEDDERMWQKNGALLYDAAMANSIEQGKKLIDTVVTEKIKGFTTIGEVVSFYNWFSETLKLKECYPEDFDKVYSLYGQMLLLREFLDAPIITMLQAEFMKRYLRLEDDEKIMVVGLQVLNKNTRISDVNLRAMFNEKLTDAILHMYGKDDGSKEYKANISELIDAIIMQDISPMDRKALVTMIADKLETKRMLSDKMKQVSTREFNQTALMAELKAITLFKELVREGMLDDERLIDFLQKDFDLQEVLKIRETIINGSLYEEKSSSRWLSWIRFDKSIKDIMEDDFISIAYSFHSEYWGMTLEQRAVVLSQILSDKKKRNPSTLFSYAFNRLLPKGTANADLIEDVLFAYIDAHKPHERLFYLAALMAAAKQGSSTSKDFNIGQPLKDFLENIGPAGIKLGQAIGSYPGTPAEIAVCMQELKQNAKPPARWELYDMVDMADLVRQRVLFDTLNLSAVKNDTYNNLASEIEDMRHERLKRMTGELKCDFKDDVPESLAEVGRVIGSGSYFVTIDARDDVLQVLRPFAAQTANSEFDTLLEAVQGMRSKHPVFASSVEQIIATAKAMVDIETDMDIGERQIKAAEEIYTKEPREVLVNAEAYVCHFKVAKWQGGGLDFKLVEKVDGVHFNDLPKGEMKTQIAKLYFEEELNHILSGGKFDHDRHGAQMKVDIDEKNHIITLGIFDNGAMAIKEPDEVSKNRLGTVLNDTITSVIAKAGKGNVAEAFTMSLNKSIDAGDYSDVESQEYICCVQRGLLALNDFMREIDTIECLKIFVKSFANADERIKASVSPKRKFLIAKMGNLLTFIDKLKRDKQPLSESTDVLENKQDTSLQAKFEQIDALEDFCLEALSAKLSDVDKNQKNIFFLKPKKQQANKSDTEALLNSNATCSGAVARVKELFAKVIKKGRKAETSEEMNMYKLMLLAENNLGYSR